MKKKLSDPAPPAPESVPTFVRYVFPAVQGRRSPAGREDPWPDAIAEEAIRQREHRSLEQGRQEGEDLAEQRFQEQLGREREALTAALGEFGRARADYFRRAEAEVVNLALTIAQKILHREVQIDPLLMSGAVRVALDKVQAATEVRLRVHPEEAGRWQEFVDNQTDVAARPEIVSDPTCERGRCLLETSLGSADLGCESQLKDLERSFRDLMAMKPAE